MKEIAIYLRLSKADKERTRESQSIQNQRALLYKAIREDASFGEYPITAYIDDGYSGLQQDRPALCTMIQKIRQKKSSSSLCKGSVKTFKKSCLPCRIYGKVLSDISS